MISYSERNKNEIMLLVEMFSKPISNFIQKEGVSNLIEIIVDINRPVNLRYTNKEVKSSFFVTQRDIDIFLNHPNLGEFNYKNRASLAGTLHRISCIRSQDDTIIGLTCRIGIAISSSASSLKALLDTDDNLLLLGMPGAGKSTKLRAIAEYLSETKRVVIVDSSNEIAGGSLYPHYSVGNSRRLMLQKDKTLADVMIEACENHYPEVIIIDEISNYKDAQAARTIAERGVRLIASAHGKELSNLMNNPPLAELIGGIDDKTMSDNYFKKAGTKSKLERKHPATFDILIELVDFDTVAIHYNIEESVDYLIRGWAVKPEVIQFSKVVQKAEFLEYN